MACCVNLSRLSFLLRHTSYEVKCQEHGRMVLPQNCISSGRVSHRAGFYFPAPLGEEAPPSSLQEFRGETPEESSPSPPWTTHCCSPVAGLCSHLVANYAHYATGTAQSKTELHIRRPQLSVCLCLIRSHKELLGLNNFSSGAVVSKEAHQLQ